MYDSSLELAVNFSCYGNSLQYCRAGWCAPEPIYTRTSGPESYLELPRPDTPGEYILRFDVLPLPESASGQKLTIAVNGTEIGGFEVRERVTVECPVGWELIDQAPAVSIGFRCRGGPSRRARGDKSTEAGTGLAFGTLILFRVGEIESTPPAAVAESQPVRALGGRTVPAPPRTDDDRLSRPMLEPVVSKQPSLPRHGDGWIDLYCYSEQACGWFAVGWVALDAVTRGAPATVERALTEVNVQFENSEAVSVPFAARFYGRSDLGPSDIGFILRLQVERGPHDQLTAIELKFGQARLVVYPSGEERHLSDEEASGWISQTVDNPSTDPAIKSLLLHSIAGRELDTEYYLARYPDVKKSGADPIAHYFDIGWRDNRDPTRWFCTKDYLDLYPDVAAGGYNPFYHFVVYGRKEGRRPNNRSDEWQTIADEFDIGFYLASYPDVAESQTEPIQHYINDGWRERRDPAPWFSTKHYLDQQHDVRDAGINPFYHYIKIGRAQRRKPSRTRSSSCTLSVSVIVPSYNHAEFLPERLESILRQTYDRMEILILDDGSTDGSREIIEDYRRRYPDKIRTLYNEQNSGSVFQQWRRGLQQARGELIWICESDDSCERTFLEVLVRHFADPSIMLAFGRVLQIDPSGIESQWLDVYRESAGAGIWGDVHVAPAYEWFRGCFSVRNVIPNVGGCIFRRQDLPDEVWARALKYRVLGDWFLYAHLVGGGRIAYDPKAVAYFRMHAANTSTQSLRTDQYYLEHLWFGMMVRDRFGVPDEISFRFYKILSDQYAEIFGEEHRDQLRRLVDLDDILRVRYTQRHIVIGIYGFHIGGAEVFAIHLANQLLELGCTVSVLCALEHPLLDNEGVRRMLDPRIAVYERDLIDDLGVESFLKSAGVDVVNSHFIAMEYLFFSENGGRLKVPYVVTMHGSYELHDVSDPDLLAFMRGVDYWVYTAQKNLGHFAGLPIDSERTVFLPNALRVDPGPFTYDRRELGADENTVIFGIATRAIPEKEWEGAIEAFRLAQRQVRRQLLLLFCGDGPELDRLEPLHRSDPDVKFLGFQPNLHGFYRLCDCCVLPTRYGGESFPLTLVQALQAGTPVIASDLGEIRSMIEADGKSAGIVLPLSGRREALVRNLADAMMRMSDDRFRLARRDDAGAIGRRYDLAGLARQYIDIFARAAKG